MRYIAPAGGARRHRPGRRRGVAAVEFAVICSLLAVLVLGMVETSRALLVREALTNAARTACRAGALPGSSNTALVKIIRDVLADHGLNADDATVTIRVNGDAADVSTAKAGQPVSVLLSVPASKVSWTTGVFLKGRNVESETYVMMRQQ